MTNLRERIEDLCARAGALTGPDGLVVIDAVRTRLDEPLRVAIAGKVKAGKSTLLNALVGERLAPTDAGECTRVVSWYREGLGYDVSAVTHDGRRRALEFRREDGTLAIDLGALALEDVDHLDVAWPSSTLRTVTLIDTPGLASLTEGSSLRTIDFLSPDDGPGQADAVLYLMRHLHRHDAAFLETFADHSLSNASPVNAIAVLSRADEIGAGRPDALGSAARIAARYREDPRVRALASTVLPVAGLIAETGLTLREEEYAWLRDLAGEPAMPDALLSVDRFVDTDLGLAPALRAELLDRLGLFGVTLSVTAVTDGRAPSAPALSRHLVEESGLPALREVLDGHFLARAEGLKCRSALSSLRAFAVELAAREPDAGRAFLAAVEEVEATSHELAELRLVHLVLAGALRLADGEETELLRLTMTAPAAERLGLDPDVDDRTVAAAALAGAERWRTRGGNPMTDPVTAEACDIAARSHEGIYARATASAT